MFVAVVACACALLKPHFLPQPVWMPIHAVALGVVSNGIFQWSWFFSRGVLHFPLEGAVRYAAFARIIVLNAGIVALFVAMWLGSVPLSVVATVLICGAGLQQGVMLARVARRHRDSRFVPVVHYYVVAFVAFVLTCALGAVLSYEMMGSNVPAWLVGSADGIAVAHSVLGIGGWAGITILGTIVVLGLSMLHARQNEKTWAWASAVLPLLVAGTLIAGIGALAGLAWMVGAGTLFFLVAASGGVLWPLWTSFGQRRRSSPTAWTLLAGVCWFMLLLAVFAVKSMLAGSVSQIRELIVTQLGIFIAAGIGQVFVASLEYLVPVAIGGGPRIQRLGGETVAFWWPLRLGLRNGALVMFFAVQIAGTSQSGLQTVLLAAILLCYAAEAVVVAYGAVRQLRAKNRARLTESAERKAVDDEK
jgi:nitrite reductase (NO-forming)